jgi:hypothetical protein
MPPATMLSTGAEALSGAMIWLLMMVSFSEGCVYIDDLI